MLVRIRKGDPRTVKKIFVLGSNSFSGSSFIAEAIDAGYEVWGISRSEEPQNMFLPYKWKKGIHEGKRIEDIHRFRFVQADINNQLDVVVDLMDTFQPDFVVNFAGQGMVAESWQSPTDWYTTNVVGQVALIEVLRSRSYIGKYLHFTTPEVYGSTGGSWVKESNVYNPTTPYAVSRAACDMHLDCYFRAYGFPVVFTRASNVYGQGQQLYRIVPKAFLCALTNSKMILHGGGLSRRSFIHIRDVSKALLVLCEEAKPGSSWHLSTDIDVSIIELVEQISALCGTSINKFCSVGSDRLGKDKSYFLDSSHIRREHGWKYTVSLEDGLREVRSWIKENIVEMEKMEWEYKHKK